MTPVAYGLLNMRILRASTVAAAILVAASAQVPKAADGHPDLSGIWQAMGTANWDLEDHAAKDAAGKK
jgi:hypothetical protein